MTELINAIENLWLLHPIGQTIGLTASLCYILATMQRNDHRLFMTQMTGAFLFIIHYAVLGAWVGALGYTAGVARNLTAVTLIKKINNPLRLTLAFLIIYGAIALLTARHAVEIIPALSGWLTAVAFFHFKNIRMRLLLLCAQGTFILYAAYVGSIGGMFTAGSEMIFTIFTISRLARTATSLPQGV
ncbi:MAG TPA: YgjV family protein [Alphaproteobacteria bacterium]|nr:YgjV family protein [Alphaproteobacteria bacterium]